jgi:GR25 family glycosyltransferase involved in LPS biosynthesis
MELFKNTLFINLENRKDRLEHANLEFKKMGINAERINAIRTTNGAIGCTLSHIHCIETAKKRGYEYVFICEDDIEFKNPELLKENLDKFYDNDKINWDMLIIGGNNVPPYHQVSDYCVRVFYCQTTTGYIVKKHYYDILIDNYKKGIENFMKNPDKPELYSIDRYWFLLQNKDNWYLIIPLSVIQKEDYSDIQKKNVNFRNYMLDYNKVVCSKKY